VAYRHVMPWEGDVVHGVRRVRLWPGAWEDEIVMKTGSRVNNVVLVHGGFVDESGWHAVYSLLKEDGYNVPGAGDVEQPQGCARRGRAVRGRCAGAPRPPPARPGPPGAASSCSINIR
jgi:hypothetical protein